MNEAQATAVPVSAADPAASKLLAEWKHASPLVSCRFDPQGRFAFAGAQDNTIQRFRLDSGAATPLVAHESWVHALAFDLRGETLLSGGCDGRLIWWPTAANAPQPLRTVEAHQGWIRALAVSPDGSLVASVGNDRVVRLWNAHDGTLARELTGHTKNIYSVLFHPTGQFLLTGDLAGYVKQWDLPSGTEVGQFDATALFSYNGGQGVDFGGVRTMALSPDGKWLACGGLNNAENPLGAVHDPLVAPFDWTTKEKKQTHATQEKLKGVAWRVVYHPNGFLIGVSGGSSGGYLLFWKPEEANEFAKLKLPDIARDMDLHPDGLRIATAHFDGHLRISIMQA